MTGKISLTASMRSNLLSLQNISRQVSATQNKLATGNKVNSAIDNPSSYYTARALNNRADDLNALLDSMGQAVSTIKAATTALETGAAFLEQAAAVATQALETTSIPTKSYFEDQDNVAAVVSDWSELKAALDSGKAGNIVIYGNIEAQDTITLKEGQNLVGVGYYGVNEPDVDKFSQLNFDMARLGISSGIKAEADNIVIMDLSLKATMNKTVSSDVISLKSGENHILQNLDIMMDTSDVGEYQSINSPQVSAINGANFKINGRNSIYGYISSTSKRVMAYGIQGSFDLYGALDITMQQGLGRAVYGQQVNLYGNADLNVYSNERGLDSCKISFYDDAKANIVGKQGSVYYSDLSINDRALVNLNGAMVGLVSSTNQPLPLTIALNSSDAALGMTQFINPNQLVEFNAVQSSEIRMNGRIYHAETAVHDNTMNGTTPPAGFAEVKGVVADPLPDLSELLEKNAGRGMGYNYITPLDSSKYDKIINQYNALIKDSFYKGINLLQDERLNVNFDENRSASLNVQGKDMSSAALGLTTLDWQTQGDIAQSLAEIASALKSIRSFSAELGNNYSIITSRQDFTENLINILTEGADKLTLADMNEESANMLALQTRQQLAVNSLSLASQAAQSVLKLF